MLAIEENVGYEPDKVSWKKGLDFEYLCGCIIVHSEEEFETLF